MPRGMIRCVGVSLLSYNFSSGFVLFFKFYSRSLLHPTLHIGALDDVV